MKAQSDFEAVEPTPDDIGEARDAAAKLADAVAGDGAMLRVGRDEMKLPASALKMLVVILGEFAKGRAVALSRVEVEVSTQRAADLLNVSRPYLVRLLEKGELPFRMVGSHRRIRLADVLDYRARLDAAAEEAYAELVAQAQELGMGYE
ncbi:MAG TPA: helix-turn-helix domain-containing protein [Longimicrobium sp.]|nr:helix-turn-helix domain-containing protein [Longimicrobium sp.]